MTVKVNLSGLQAPKERRSIIEYLQTERNEKSQSTAKQGVVYIAITRDQDEARQSLTVIQEIDTT